MSRQLLKSKLYIPPIRPEVVQRPQLLERLNNAILPGVKLVLVSAPPGFGKTTLLADWVHQSDYAIGWVSLDPHDNDPVQFWSYVILALQTVGPGIGKSTLASLQSQQTPTIESTLTELINEINDIIGEWVLILDDFHVITEPQINQDLLFLLEHLPRNMHLILSTRADPPWPLARLRARRTMVELRMQDLRFAKDEVSIFLNTKMGLKLSADDIALLDARTEGWIAGLQLAALSMHGRDANTFVQSFGASHRFVLDYLMEEVLDRQPPEIQAFLLETSVLDRLTGPLCDAVRSTTAGEEVTTEVSQTTLEHLEQANLFVIPLDDERRWYRYHHLFADLLRTRLKQTLPHRLPRLHLAASKWYEGHGLIADAVEHALAADDVEQVAHLVEHRALSMIYHGELRTLTGWLRTLSPSAMEAHPWLRIAYAWALAYAGELEGAEEKLLLAEDELGESTPNGQGSERIRGHIAAIRGYCTMLRGDAPCATKFAYAALRYLPEEELATRGFAAVILGTILGVGGDAALSFQLFAQALAAGRAAGDDLLEILTLCEMSALQYKLGRLHASAATAQEALHLSDAHTQRSGQLPPAAGFAHVRLAAALYEWNELETSTEHAKEAIALFRQWGQRDGLLIAYFCLAHLNYAAGDLDGAIEMTEEAKGIAIDLTWYQDIITAFETWLHVVQAGGSRDALLTAFHWGEKKNLDTEREIDLDAYSMYVHWARILIAVSRANIVPWAAPSPREQALRLLTRLLTIAERAGAVRLVVKALVLQAIALQEGGESEVAQATLLHALKLAQPEGYMRTFIEEGEPLQRLLADMSRQRSPASLPPSPQREYLHKLLDACADARSAPPPLDIKTESPHRPPPNALLDPLSERELDVLRLLPTDLTSTEIADHLYISKNTARTHIKHIYDKLGVHSREDAVLCAQDLGLL